MSKFEDIVSFFSIPENQQYLEKRYENDVTLLMYALAANREDVACFLVEIGVDVNAENIFGMTALHYACQDTKVKYFLNIIKKLLENGADVNTYDILGQTPLDYTLFEIQVLVDPIKNVQLLLEAHGGRYGNSVREQYAMKLRNKQ